MTSLENHLILHRFLCNEFGYDDLSLMLERLRNVSPRSTATGKSEYARALYVNPDLARVTPDQFLHYDDTITEISRQLRMTGASGRVWKPHQYLALLLAEHYLNRYFDDPAGLLDDLNQAMRLDVKTRSMPAYTIDSLRTVAVQSATGSGKTLIMHAHLLQYRRLAHDAGKSINNIVLVTPNQQMSEQHYRDFSDSGLPARLFSSEAGTELFSPIEIIDLNKLSTKQGVKRVAVSDFGENNLVLVDEGHLGASGHVWRKHRSELARSGFTFEYSATFNQIVGKDDDLFMTYAKSMLFDYPYRTFHAEGYGKDYVIANLPKGGEDINSRMYLLGCLLSFYLQCAFWRDNHTLWMDFDISRPLWVFLGKTVTGGSKADQATQSDVLRIIEFLAWFLAHGDEVGAMMKRLLNGQSGLTDEATGKDFFGSRFDCLEINGVKELYGEICQLIFHGQGALHVVYLTQGEGELHLSTADNVVFGVINIGDSAALHKLLGHVDDSEFTLVREPGFARRLFPDVDRSDSTVNIVIGARRFIAGWNSWRVSTMGLMHVGVGEGPEIIQMFGRGVRLKGWKMSLKRHTRSGASIPPNSEKLKELETLRIFGLRSRYMEIFRTMLEEQGIKEQRVALLPVIWTFARDDLKIIRLKENRHYSESCERPILPSPDRLPLIEMNLYSQLQTAQSAGNEMGIGTDHTPVRLTSLHTAFFDRTRIYDKILLLKAQHEWRNLTINRSTVDQMLEQDSWYRLFLPPDQLVVSSCDDIRKLEDIMVDLISTCINQYWQQERARWEHKHLELTALEETDPNNFGEYQLSVGVQEAQLADDIQILVEDFRERLHHNLNLGKIMRDALIVKPLIYEEGEKSKVTVQPVPLDLNEKEVVTRLADLAENRAPSLQGYDLYLLRNMSSGRGVSFFEDRAYYPDFIMWLTTGERQHIVFIDPKGLSRYGPNERLKVALHTKIKDIENRLNNRDSNVQLHAYILSVTPPHRIGGESMPKSLWEDHGVFFLEDDDWETKLLSDILRD